MIEAIQEQHQKGIINHDIKLENFLVAEVDGKLQIWSQDLGLARLQGEGGVAGSPEFYPPEAFMGINSQEKKDIYSLACALFALHARGTDDILPWFAKEDLNQGIYESLYDSYTPVDSLDRLLYRMAHPDPSRRPTIEEVYKEYSNLRL